MTLVQTRGGAKKTVQLDNVIYAWAAWPLDRNAIFLKLNYISAHHLEVLPPVVWVVGHGGRRRSRGRGALLVVVPLVVGVVAVARVGRDVGGAAGVLKTDMFLAITRLII